MRYPRDEKTRHLKALGRAFAEARKEADLTQAELHNRSGVHQVTIARIETGAMDPGYEVIQKMATGIGIPLGPILDRAWELAGKKQGGR